MSEIPCVHRQRRADELRTLATQVLATARHHGLQDFVRRAVGQIDEASRLLERTNVSERPGLLTIIDMELALAEYRLRAATLTLTMRGADADDIC